MKFALHKLPETVQALLKETVEAINAIEANPKYRFDMTQWHKHHRDGSCEVCLAGAWLAHFMVKDPNATVSACGIPRGARNIMHLLNHLRTNLWFFRHKDCPEEVAQLAEKWEEENKYFSLDPVAVTGYIRELEAVVSKLAPIPLPTDWI